MTTIDYLSRGLAGVTLILGITLSVVAYQSSQEADQQKVISDFDNNAANLLNSVQLVFQESITQVESLQAYLNATPRVSQTQFGQFTQQMLESNPSVQALEWAPWVIGENRASFENRAKNENPGFFIGEQSKDGATVPAKDRPVHVPVHHVSPLRGNEAAVGYDLLSNSSRAEAIYKAIDTKSIVATEWISLVQDKESGYGFLLLTPVFHQGMPTGNIEERRKAIRGFALGVFRINKLMDQAFSSVRNRNMAIILNEEVLRPGSSTPSRSVFYPGSYQDLSPEEVTKKVEHHHFITRFVVGGRTWEVDAHPFIGGLEVAVSWEKVALLGIGVLVSTILAFLLYQREIKSRLLRNSVVEISEAKQKAENANTAKNRFLSSMSHELRNQLGTVLSYAELMNDEANDGDHHEEDYALFSQRISKAGHHLLSLVEDILDLSRIENDGVKITPQLSDPKELVEESVELMHPEVAAKRINLRVHVATNQAILVDPLRFRQVLINLISNAIKYNQQEGQVYINVDSTEHGKVRISVRDTGIGINSDNLHHIFDPFNRLGAENTQVVGTGIGLTIAKRLVELMGGEIGVESSHGVGSCFWVEFPESGMLLHPEKQKLREPRAGTGEQFAILYVEDNVEYHDIVGRIVERMNARLNCIPTAETALEIARVEQPDLVLMDLNLPGMDGFEAFKRLKKMPETSEIPVIAISAGAMVETREKVLAAGFVSFVPKPIFKPLLIREISGALPVRSIGSLDQMLEQPLGKPS